MTEINFALWADNRGISFERKSCYVEIDSIEATCYAIVDGVPSAFVGVAGSAVGWAPFTLPAGVEVTVPTAPPAPAMPAASGPATTFGDGIWIVGTDIAPGAYRAPGGSLCYWARLADFSGEDIIANHFTDTSTQVLVEIAASDVAFETTGCGTWEPI